MLQQTRVAAVLEHYQEFLRRFPNVEALASAPPARVLAAWSGLGYYRRARALHRAARVVVNEREGRIPRTSAELRELPGIGPYTAAAIASIAFGEPSAVVDGNVQRVLERLCGRTLSRVETWSTAERLVSASRPGDSNQAMMELGATVCVPGEPKCHSCPVKRWCATTGKGPGAAVKQSIVHREVAYMLVQRDGRVLMVQRPASAQLMPRMWELPGASVPINGAPVLMRLKHSITNTEYAVSVVAGGENEVPDGRWVKSRSLARLPLTGLARKVLRQAGALR
jgi:A/G-specific adenine glycosylase